MFPAKDEINALIANAPPKHQPLIMTALLTGMRMSELRGLTWDAIDFNRSIITVRKRADRYWDMGNTKSKSGRREIPMGPGLAKVLKAWKPLARRVISTWYSPTGLATSRHTRTSTIASSSH